MGFAKFMASSAGRIMRIVAGIALMVAGYAMHSTTGYILAAVGLLPLAAGVFDWCIFAPLLGAPFRGRNARRA